MKKEERLKINLRSDKTEYLSNDEVYSFFVESKKLDEITKIRNTFLVGHKGSGKTFILKYLSVPIQLIRFEQKTSIEFDEKAIGILIQCKVGRFGGLRETVIEDTLNKDWVIGFTHLFNLCAVEIFLEAINGMANEDIHVVMFGSTNKDVSGLIAVPSTSLGFLSNVDALRLAYSAADVFVAPSRADAFGKTLVEAMLPGFPCHKECRSVFMETGRETSIRIVQITPYTSCLLILLIIARYWVEGDEGADLFSSNACVIFFNCGCLNPLQKSLPQIGNALWRSLAT